jgi:hypothetical protein
MVNISWRGGHSGNSQNDAASNAPLVSNTTGLPVRQGFGTTFRAGQPPVAREISRASGNPDESTIPQQEPSKRPLGYPRPLNVGQESAWRGGADFANDKLIAPDRHVIMNSGKELSGRDSGETDPPMDGPPRPSMRIINRTINWQVGNPLATQDELPGENRAYNRNAQGNFVGEQGSGWSPVYGGVPGLYQPYGSYQGYTTGPVKGIQSPVAQGEPGDGPGKVWAGPPHGLHSQTIPDYSATLGYYMAVPQMRAPRVDRPSNSTSAGQSYSQTVQPQGQTGTVGQQAGSGVNWRAKPAGWRGQTQ